MQDLLARADAKDTVFFVDRGDGGGQKQLRAVVDRIACGGSCQRVRANDARACATQRTDRFVGNVRLKLVEFFCVQNGQPIDAVLQSALIQRADGYHIVFRKSQNQRAVGTVRNAQLFGECGHHLRAAHVELCFERTGNGVKAAVRDCTVGACRSRGNVLTRFDQRDRKLVFCQFSCEQAAHNTCADDGDVKTFHICFCTLPKHKSSNNIL